MIDSPRPAHPRRPDPLRWFWYALGGKLPASYREWVLYDASCGTWVLRHFIRAFVQIAVVAPPIGLLVPGPPWVRLSSLLLGTLVGLQYALWFIDGSVDRRVRRAGFPEGAAQQARDRRTADERALAEARYASRYRADLGAVQDALPARPSASSVVNDDPEE